MIKPKDAKARALESLSNCWGKAAAVVLFIATLQIIVVQSRIIIGELFIKEEMLPAMGLLSATPTALIINIVFWVLGVVLLAPVDIGQKWWLIHAVRGAANPVKAIFICYAKPGLFFRTVALRSLVLLLRMLGAIPLGIAFYFIYKSVDKAMQTNNSAWIVLLLCGIIALACIAAVYVYYAMRFALCGYLFAINPERPIISMVKMSVQMMKRQEFHIIRFILSFTPWFLSCLLVFPIFFVAPYFSASYTVVINRILAENAPRVKR